ncbi:HAD-IA family hydrolase [Brevirhabdus sp.]|uniref:HAD-IA family hydrolase n=1 Tax=Brevirhabdus sp. TaxID=2004514 RepID=UPI00405888A6
MTTRTVIFDLDGTLADTSGDLIAAANHCFRGLGHGDLLDMRADRSTAFHGGRAMLRLGGERLQMQQIALADMIEAQYPVLLEAYGNNIDTHTTLYPGLEAALERLAEDGFVLGVCTNKPFALAEVLMDRLNLRRHFASMIGADTLPVRKPDPAPLIAAVEQAGGTLDRAILVGDTQTDRLTGRAAGVPVVLVTFGPDGLKVRDLQPEATLDHYDDLHRVVQDLLG